MNGTTHTPNPDPDLIDLALVKFPDLTSPEKKLIEAAQRGSWTILADEGATGDDESEDSKRAREIRADLIRWLCTDKTAAEKVDTRGIKVKGAMVKGTLDLSFTSVLFALELEESDFPDGLDLKSAQLARLSLGGSKVRSLWAPHLVTLGDVSLNYGFSATGSVILDRCRIAGDVNCRMGTFSASEKTALSLHSGKIEGSVLMWDGFSATGEVNLGSASISGNLICSGGSFGFDKREIEKGQPKDEKVAEKASEKENREEQPKDLALTPPRAALQANQLRVGGSAFLRDGLEIRGEANLIGANIVGDLDCRGARFSNPGKPALIADRITIGSNALFQDRFETDGLIILTSASIAGNLYFEGMRFFGESLCGLRLDVATVKRTLSWRNIEKTPETILNLDDSEVGLFLDDHESWPGENKLSLTGFRYGRISGAPTLGMRIRWLQLSRKGVSLQPYQQLASVLKAAGHENDAKRVAIAREDNRRRHSGLSWWVRLWKYFLKITVGYGYAPRRALYWAAGMILLGWFLFGTGYQKSLFSPVADRLYRDPEYLQSNQSIPSGYQTFNSLVYSIDAFLPIIDLHQESKWLPNPTQKCTVLGREISGGGLLRFYLWIHIIAGWALTTLTVAGFTGVIRKE